MCERPPRSLRSRLPLTRGRLRLQRESFILPLREGESRRRRQGFPHTPSRIGVGQQLRSRGEGQFHVRVRCIFFDIPSMLGQPVKSWNTL
jgi:hypothetical protein